MCRWMIAGRKEEPETASESRTQRVGEKFLTPRLQRTTSLKRPFLPCVRQAPRGKAMVINQTTETAELGPCRPMERPKRDQRRVRVKRNGMELSRRGRRRVQRVRRTMASRERRRGRNSLWCVSVLHGLVHFPPSCAKISRREAKSLFRGGNHHDPALRAADTM